MGVDQVGGPGWLAEGGSGGRGPGRGAWLAGWLAGGPVGVDQVGGPGWLAGWLEGLWVWTR